ncbi:aminotransferase class III-fold pyridoxal phosphate-dependent enzyme [Gammaproteobacteria bacterium]|nr:aminotransferase class III-fold pyridoxal phosphate-dependent enzyme [Gammaproteobacteria bacterium]
MKIAAIVQARMGSSRFPGKVMKLIQDTPMIEILIKRLSKSKLINQIIVATSINDENTPLVNHLESLNIECEIGSEEDVLSRYYNAAKKNQVDVVVRITGDCPLVDADLVDRCIREFVDKDVSYVSNVSPCTFPDGLDVEVFSFEALEDAYLKNTHSTEKEHVTPYIINSDKYKKSNIKHSRDLSKSRWTVDEVLDFEVIKEVFNYFSPNVYFSWEEVVKLEAENPDIFSKNKNIKRNDGANMGKGQKLWKRAKNIIPGGNMLLSKRSEMFLPDKWPSYFSKSKGCEVWDLDDNKFIDMTIMGVGTNTLGYGHPEVDEAVLKNINNGNMSTLNCPEEVQLAEKLVDMHSWAEMVRFARSGGEANAIAIRIARAASGKDNVAVCGYHGWHDWYLSANLSGDDNLESHLLPGLMPNGVPKNLQGTVFPFLYNDFESLKSIVDSNDIGVIKMEVTRNTGPEDNFLKKVRDLADSKNIVLIFDECTSGFRETFGGIHMKFDVEPDMAMFGKTMGNGYGITAVVGKKEIMESAQASFISSTFWTERIGPTAALKTLEVMENIQSWKIITDIGKSIREKLKDLAFANDLDITFSGIPALTTFSFNSDNDLEYKTLITQEMLKKNFLATNAIYTCINHTPNVIDDFILALDPIFKDIKECENGKDVKKLLEGPTCHSGFKRLN